MFSLAVLFFIAASIPSSDPAVDGIMKQREAEIKKAAETYESLLRQADGRALKQLAALLKNGASAKDRKALDSVKKAMAQIEEQPEPVLGVFRKEKPGKSSVSSEDYPDGTFAKFGRHFYVFPVKMNHEDAKNACFAVGGTLLKINNEEEFNYFVGYASSEKKVFWLDMTYSKSENKWTNGKGEKNPFVRWRKGYPVSAPDADSVLVDCKGSRGDMINISGLKAAETVICEWDK